MKKSIATLLLASVVGLAGNAALAQYDYEYDYEYDATIGTGIGVGLIIIWIVVMVVNLALFVFWLWMLIDVIKRKFDQKVLWIVLIIILGYLGAIIYYFAVKRKKVGETPSGPASPQAPTAPQPPPTPPQQPQA